jgi:hypothetical protein
VNNGFEDWYDGAPVTPGDLSFSFDDWHDGAPVPIYITSSANTIDADTGSFTLSGGDATFSVARTIGCTVGAFTLSGSDAIFGGSLSLVCSTGEFLLSGANVTFNYSPYTPPEPPPQPSIGGGMLLSRRRVHHGEQTRSSSTRAQTQTLSPRSTALSVECGRARLSLAKSLTAIPTRLSFKAGGARLYPILRDDEEEALLAILNEIL